MVNNICIKCGKERIVIQTSTEVIGTATIIRSETACPDPDCQLRLDNELTKEREKRLQAINSSHGMRVIRK